MYASRDLRRLWGRTKLLKLCVVILGGDSNATSTLEVVASMPNLAAQFAADTNSYTLSRQLENIAALGVEWCSVFACSGREARLERLAAGESGFDIVPPFDIVALIGLPTQQHDATVTHGGEID